MPKKKIALVVILLIMLVSIGWYYFCYDKVDKLTATGTIEVTKYDVTPRLAGYIRNLKLEEGDSLNLGDFVCEIEREDLRAQNIGDWQAVKEAQAKLQDLKMAQGNKKLLWQKIVCKRHKSFLIKLKLI